MDGTKYFTIFLPSLIKNDKLAENILVMKYISEDDDNEVNENLPVIDKLVINT